MFDDLYRRAREILRMLRTGSGPFTLPGDPSAAVREPRRGRPGGRSGAVALAEPEPWSHVRATGTTGASRADTDPHER
jgi:hypothetical protein